MSKVFKNRNSDDVFVTTDKYDIERLSSLDNWDLLEGKARERALEASGQPDIPMSEIGEVSEQYDQHGAGTDHNPDALNEDKLSHAADSEKAGQEAKKLDELTLPQLKAFAKENEIDLGGAKSKQEVLDLLTDHDAPLRPAQGADLTEQPEQ
jgi:hypothetical protein